MNHPDNLTAIREPGVAVDEVYAEARRLSGKVVIGGMLRSARTTEVFAVENRLSALTSALCRRMSG
ncbi:MAG TPA: hypothetical protein VFJ48_04075 [Casimicrobiaceae bacterium]|nr:hypothetical protein [Casimicrobiaceae bacterium]